MQTIFPKKLLVASSLFLIASFVVFVVIYKDIENNDATADKNSKDTQIEIARRDNLIALDNLIKKIEKDRLSIEKHFIRGSDIVPFLDTIDSLGVKSGVDSSVSNIDTLADKSALLVEVKANGSFESIYKFLVLLENSPYELNFASMDLQKEENTDTTSKKVVSNWTVTFKIKLVSFTQ